MNSRRLACPENSIGCPSAAANEEVSPMKDMMEKMMARMAKPEDMLGIMKAMMDRMFSGMTTDDRIRFMTMMMTQCLGVVMAEMTTEERQKLVRWWTVSWRCFRQRRGRNRLSGDPPGGAGRCALRVASGNPKLLSHDGRPRVFGFHLFRAPGTNATQHDGLQT